MREKKISIVVPVYNAEKELPACVESIFRQSFSDWELLLIDDGSRDGSPGLCDRLAERDLRIRVYHKENGGVSSARNLGIYKAEGEYLIFVDSDDTLFAEALADLYQRLISKVGDASFVYLDEFDAFYHYEMSENVIRFFKQRYPECQIVMTSHNTNLMTNRIMRPDCLFILSQRGTLTALCSATERELREGHNLEKMYISGEFEKYE